MHATFPLLRQTDFPSIQRQSIDTIQANLGYRCNQTCQHCHVNAGPHRAEMMTEETVDLILDAIKTHQIKTLDLTGGAPELSPHFKYLVRAAHGMGVHVIDRCNLTVLFEPDQEDTARFLADHQVEVVASLPCYSQKNVDKQRGNGVFDKSITALRWLNRLGYGQEDGKLALNLVYNPLGAFLPPNQQILEQDYKRELRQHFDIGFNSLYVLANMPIKRFGSMLISEGEFAPYMKLLKDNYSPANLETVMCRTLISVDWRGYIYDCDFNQMLEMPMRLPSIARSHLRDLLNVDGEGLPISIADHCYGCTAGQGSSCCGALAA